MNIAFTTERLYIRFAQIADAAELLKLVNQANFTKYIGDKGIYTLDDAKKYIKDSFIAAHKEHGFGPYIITLHDETIIGIVGFYQRATMQHPDLGFALKDGFEKKGYIINWKSLEKQDLNETINALAMASPFSLEEKQILLESKNLEARKDKISEILSTYSFDDFHNTTIQ